MKAECSTGASAYKKEFDNAVNVMKEVPHKILVMSGKGGVGKTTVAVNLALAMAEAGMKAGVLDVDIHGPNVPLMLGIEGTPGEAKNGKLQPVMSEYGVGVISVSAFLPDRDLPVIWRGPRKNGAIRQFIGDTDWKDTEVLVVDCPPGTGDEPMAVAELIPDADGVVIVTSPQDVALLDSRKCVNFVREVSLPVLGIVENLSGFVCPGCGRELNLFKVGGGEKAASDLAVTFLGRIPITEQMVEAGDSGKPLVKEKPDDAAAKAITEIAAKIRAGFKKENSADSNDQAEDKIAKKEGARLIAIAGEDDKGLEGEVSAHFGRCPYYTMVEVVDKKITDSKIVKNPHFGAHAPGVMPKFIHSLGADVILAGGMGPQAINMFQNFGIDVVTGGVGRVGAVVEAYLDGRLKGIVACEHDHPESCGGH